MNLALPLLLLLLAKPLLRFLLQPLLDVGKVIPI